MGVLTDALDAAAGRPVHPAFEGAPGTGIRRIRDEALSPSAYVGWGANWGCRDGSDGVERPVWFFGVRDDIPADHPLRERFRTLAELKDRIALLMREGHLGYTPKSARDALSYASGLYGGEVFDRLCEMLQI